MKSIVIWLLVFVINVFIIANTIVFIEIQFQGEWGLIPALIVWNSGIILLVSLFALIWLTGLVASEY